jgi:hypothetical protein
MDAGQLCVLFPWLADASMCLGAHLLGALPPTSLSLSLSLSLSFSLSRLARTPRLAPPPRLPFLRLHDFTLPVRHVGLLSHRNATRARLLRSQASGSTRLPLACFSPTIRDLASKRPPVFLEALLTLHPLRRAPDAAFCAISFPSPNTTRPLAPQLPLCNVSFVPSVSCVHPCLISSSD